MRFLSEQLFELHFWHLWQIFFCFFELGHHKSGSGSYIYYYLDDIWQNHIVFERSYK